MPVKNWSTTASSNATADNASGIDWSEGMPPAQVNDSARAMMAVIKGDLANSLALNGYQKFPNGLVLQWGRAVPAAADSTVTLPIAFPGGALGVVATLSYQPGANDLVVAHCDTLGLTQFNLRVRYALNGGSVAGTAQATHWLAWGF